jgi:hypothetical protein
MASPKDIFAAHKFPGFVKDHSVFKKLKSINKIFPDIGLPNCEEETVIDNSKEIAASADALVSEIQNAIDKRLRNIKKWVDKKEKLSEKRKAKYDECVHILNEMKGLASSAKARKKFLTPNNGKFTLNLPADITASDNKPVFKGGEGLFRAYNKMSDVLHEGKFVMLDKLDNMHSFKDFSAKNIPATKHKIVFSSDGPEGAWDIATMSMRGIQSCQTWGTNAAPGNSAHIVGNMVDPFTGIIYLTTGAKFNEHGSKMIRRCVVRFIVDRATKKPHLMLERMYPADDKSVLDSFKAFLTKRTDGKFEVLYGGQYGIVQNKYVPMSKTVEGLDLNAFPYRDSGITYEVDTTDNRYVQEQMKRDMDRIVDEFTDFISASIRTLKAGEFSDDMQKAVQTVKQTYAAYVRNYIAPLIKKKVKAKTKELLIDWIGSNIASLVSDGLTYMDKAFGYKAINKVITEKVIGGVEKKYKLFAKKEIAKIEKEKTVPVETGKAIYAKLLEDPKDENKEVKS